MKKFMKQKKQALAVITSLCLTVGMSGIPVYAQSSSGNFTKNENVYAKLAADGTAAGAYVVNVFDIKNAAEITDYGTYNEIKNLSDLTPLNNTKDSTTISAEAGKFYYQGALEKAELPWLISISYRLDGNKITPEELGGKSGKLEISLRVRQNPAADSIFYENYLMQISLSLDSEKCTGITAPDATLADAGASQQLTFTVMPDTDADFTIAAAVSDFTMSGFSMAAVPYSVNIGSEEIETDDLTSQFSELNDAVDLLSKGTNELSDGIRELNNGGSPLLDGSNTIKNGLSTLSQTSPELTDASYQIGTALDMISTNLSGADLSSMDSLRELPAALTQLSGALSQMKDGLAQLNSGFSQSYAALDAAVSAAAAEAPTDAEFAALQMAVAASPDAATAFQKLMDSFQKLMILRETYAAVKPGFDAVNTVLDPANPSSLPNSIDSVAAGLNTMSSSLASSLEGSDLSSMLKQLQSGLSDLTDNYAAFHNGLLQYTDGVSTLSNGYEDYHHGLKTYLNGVSQLDSGSSELADGMNELSTGVKDIPDQMQSTIDEMMEKYNSSDFDAVSFVDSRNQNINSVQFIFSTDGIVLPEKEAEPETEQKEGFLDRLKNLF